jgi:two-component system sensor histidine kinase YesM
MIVLRRLWRSLFVKFSVSFFFVGMIPLFALSIFSLQTFSGHVERYTVGNLQQMSIYMSYNLNNTFNDFNGISQLMYKGFNEGGGSAFINQTVQVNQYERINTALVDDFLKTVLYSNPGIRSTYFSRTVDNKLYYQTRVGTAFFPEKLPIEKWVAPLKEMPRQLVIYPTHEEDYYFNSPKNVITIGRNLIDISGPPTLDPKVVGTLFFDVDVQIFEELFSELTLGANDELYVLDGNDIVYFSNVPDVMGSQKTISEQTDENRLVLSEELDYLDGRVVLRISKKDLFAQLSSTNSAVYLAIAICAIILILMGAWFSRRLATPIRGVIKQMSRVESGDLDAQIEVRGQDEISRLAYGFNRMVDRLKAFIDGAYIAEIKRKQTELNALKSQLRPHYLYNTLEVIRMNAVFKDDSEVADMILSLSNQLKYVIDYGEEWVSIRRELQHLKDYFYIISVRYENQIELRCEVAEAVDLDGYILKLSLQPIVENAIQHGLRPKGGKGTVMVTIEMDNELLAVTIYDDGVGMDEDTLVKLNEHLHHEGPAVKGIGMKNVHEQIVTLCGEGYGLTISSRKHIGTSVTMRLPIRKEMSGNGNSSDHSG